MMKCITLHVTPLMFNTILKAKHILISKPIKDFTEDIGTLCGALTNIQEESLDSGIARRAVYGVYAELGEDVDLYDRHTLTWIHGHFIGTGNEALFVDRFTQQVRRIGSAPLIRDIAYMDKPAVSVVDYLHKNNAGITHAVILGTEVELRLGSLDCPHKDSGLITLYVTEGFASSVRELAKIAEADIQQLANVLMEACITAGFPEGLVRGIESEEIWFPVGQHVEVVNERGMTTKCVIVSIDVDSAMMISTSSFNRYVDARFQLHRKGDTLYVKKQDILDVVSNITAINVINQ